ncbi:hypothetical protein GCM10020256_11160 [Streptomyces thermocoprophilus]
MRMESPPQFSAGHPLEDDDGVPGLKVGVSDISGGSERVGGEGGDGGVG